jgi:hypothetical protein
LAQNVRWSRIFAEGAAIVRSILPAFGIQAWRQHVQEETATEVDRNLARTIQASDRAGRFRPNNRSPLAGVAALPPASRWTAEAR